MNTELPGGGTVAYDDAGRGQPLVLLHAFPLDRAMWRPQVEALRTDYRVLTPDLRGFGGTSPFTGTPALEQMADDVAALLDAAGVREPVVLGGLSMGGYVTLAFVRKYPERLRGLILADTRADADSAEARSNRDRLVVFARSNPARAVAGQLLPKLLSEATRERRPEVVAEVERLAAAQSAAGLVGALQAMRDRPDSTDLLRRVTVPTLVVVGAADALTPPALAQAMVQALPDARLATIEWAGHLANLEQPEAFNAAVRAFLDALP
jgi:pimeloyl-ACP methyl ester carboxylesterase